jgi:hypothetical protein
MGEEEEQAGGEERIKGMLAVVEENGVVVL